MQLKSAYSTPEWIIAERPVAYPDALAAMDARVAAIATEQAAEQVWLLEHPPLYTMGTSAQDQDVLNIGNIPVFATGRGGKVTYHGPGQRVAYVMLNLRARDNDVRKHVWRLEEWAIRTLAAFGVVGERRCERIGIWVVTPRGEEKIAAIGVRVRHGVTLHGLAINVAPDLAHFKKIIPCGLPQFGVTSLQALGKNVSLTQLDEQLKAEWKGVFEN